MYLHYSNGYLTKIYDTDTMLTYVFNNSGEHISTVKEKVDVSLNFKRVSIVGMVQSNGNCVVLAKQSPNDAVLVQKRISMSFSEALVRLMSQGMYISVLRMKGEESGIKYNKVMVIYNQNVNITQVYEGIA